LKLDLNWAAATDFKGSPKHEKSALKTLAVDGPSSREAQKYAEGNGSFLGEPSKEQGPGGGGFPG
jgi:hypothetical protein